MRHRIVGGVDGVVWCGVVASVLATRRPEDLHQSKIEEHSWKFILMFG
jgi:hypothetical protein